MSIEVEKLEGHVSVTGTAKAIAELKALKAAYDDFDAKGSRSRKVDLDTGGSDDKLRRLNGGLDVSTQKMFKFNEAVQMGGTLVSAIQMPAMAQGLLSVGAAANTASAGVVALLGPLGSLGGLLGAIPAMGVTLGSVLTVVKTSMSGLGGALKEQTANTKSAEAASAAQGKGLSIASQNARSMAAAVDGVAAAERSLMFAQRSATEAQERLGEARKEAGERLFDMRLQSKTSALDEQQALYDLIDAKKALTNVGQDNWVFGKGYVTSDDVKSRNPANERRDALMNVRRAELAIIRIKEDRKRSEEDLAVAERKGIDNSDLVVQATRSQEAANYALQQSIKAVADARRNVGDTQVSNAATGSPSGGSKASTTEYDKLPKAGKDFVDYYQSTLKPTLDDLKKRSLASFAPGLLEAVKSATPALMVFKSNIDSIGFAMGDVTSKLGRTIGNDQWASDLPVILGQSNDLIHKMGDGIVFFVDGMRDVAITAEPVTRWLGDTVKKWGEMTQNWAAEGRSDGSLIAFFDKATVNADKFFKVLGNMWGTIKGIAHAAEPLGDWLMDSLVAVTEQQKIWAQSAEGQQKMAGYFESQKEPLSALARLFGEVARSLFRITNDPSVGKLADQLTDRLLPAVESVVKKFQGGELAPQMVDGIASLVDLIGQFAEYQGGLSVTIGMLSTFVKVLNGLLESHPLLVNFLTAWLQLNAAMKVGRMAGAITGISSLTQAINGGKGKAGLLTVLQGKSGLISNFKTFIQVAQSQGLGTALSMTSSKLKAVSIAGPAAIAALAGGAAMVASIQSWKATRREVEGTLSAIVKLGDQGDVESVASKSNKLKQEYNAAQDRLAAAQSASNAKKVVLGLQTGFKELTGQKSLVDDASMGSMYNVIDQMTEMAEKQAHVVHDKMEAMRVDLGLTQSKWKELQKAYKLDPAVMDYSEMYTILAQHRDQWGGIKLAVDSAKTAIMNYWNALSRKDDPNNPSAKLMEMVAAFETTKKSLGDVQVGPDAAKGGKLDLKSEGAGALLSNIKQQRDQMLAIVSERLKGGLITEEQASASMGMFVMTLRKQLKEKLGSDAAADDLLRAFGLDPAGQKKVTDEIAKVSVKTRGAWRAAIAGGADYTEMSKILNEAMRLNGKTMDENTEAGRTNAEVMSGYVKRAYIEGNAALWRTSKTTKEYQGRLSEMTDELLDQITPWFKNREAAGEYLKKVTDIPDSVVTTAVANTAEAESNMDAYIGTLTTALNISNALTGAVDSVKTGFTNAFGGTGRASGGFIHPGDFLVGENGPERLRIDKTGHGRIMPTGASSMYPQGGMGGDVGSGLTTEDIERAFRNVMQDVDFGKKIEMTNNFPTAIDPKAVTNEIAWALR